MRLTDAKCKSAKPKSKPYKLFDGSGLFLLVDKSGKKYWRYKYRFGGKEKLLSLGVYPNVSLNQARKEHRTNKELLEEGNDPSLERKKSRINLAVAQENDFESISREWHEVNKERWSTKYERNVMARLEGNIFPHLGSHPIQQINAMELLSVLRIVEGRGAFDLANRLLRMCGQVFRFAVATGRVERDITVDLKGALKTRKVKHNAYLKEEDMNEFFVLLQNYRGDYLTRLALELLALTFVRTIELRGARWSEINTDKKEWRVPAERMKMDTLHIVPLSKQSIRVLKTIKKISGNRELVFPNTYNPLKCMSEGTLINAIYRMGYRSRLTAHGLRSTASTILNENGFNPDAVERQLAHIERNNVRAAYNHAQYLGERRKMMQFYADFIDKKRPYGRLYLDDIELKIG